MAPGRAARAVIPTGATPMNTSLTRAGGLFGLAALIAAALPPAAGQDKKPAKPYLTFVVFKDDKSTYRWRLTDESGTVVARADKGFPDREGVRDQVERVRKVAGTDKAKYEVYQDPKMLYRWRLKAEKGEVLAESGDGQQDKAAADKVIERVKTGAKDAEVVDKTITK
jgi:uncharacterized protein YegP (UPF0339 family)